MLFILFDGRWMIWWMTDEFIYNFTWLRPIVNGNLDEFTRFFFHFSLPYVNFGSYTKHLISFFCSKAGSMEAWTGCAKSGWKMLSEHSIFGVRRISWALLKRADVWEPQMWSASSIPSPGFNAVFVPSVESPWILYNCLNSIRTIIKFLPR